LRSLDRRGGGLRGHGISAPGSAMRLSFESIDRRLEQAAGTLGANRMWTLFSSAGRWRCRHHCRSYSGFARALGIRRDRSTFVSNIPGETNNRIGDL